MVKVTLSQRQHCVTVLQCYSSKIKLWRVKNKLYIYIYNYIYKYRSIFRGLTNLFENCNTVTSVTVKTLCIQQKKFFEIIIFLRKHSRTAMPLPYLCNVNLRDENLRSYKKKITGLRGSKNFNRNATQERANYQRL